MTTSDIQTTAPSPLHHKNHQNRVTFNPQKRTLQLSFFLSLPFLVQLLNSLFLTDLFSLMGDIVLTAFLQVAFDRLANPDFMDFVLRWKINLDEVDSLRDTSTMIQALSDEAEVKQFTNLRVKLWLHRLKQLLYDAEDILDEYATEVLRLKLESEYQTQQVRNTPVPLIPSESNVSSFFKSSVESAVKGFNEKIEVIKGIGPKVYNFADELQRIKRFGSKVRDIDEKLKTIAKEDIVLGLSPSIGSGSSRFRLFNQRPPTSSLVMRSKVVGREEDMEKIIGWLLTGQDSDNNFSVLPIVGMGGVGKTTLAQLVYNDERVKKHFGLKAWVCVSEDFDVVRLTKEILESTIGSSLSSNSLDVLQVKLQDVLSEKRFLLVLDDMWNEKYDTWDTLRTPFAFGESGSKILVTTRHKRVASIVSTVSNDHDLKGLSDMDCFELVRRHAFRDGNSLHANGKLEVFGEKIVKKCKGLPLAVKTLAGLLRDKRENSEWKDVLENEIWDLRESEILPSLMLSYHHLPPIMKRCFTYCALFPKDYVFNKIEIVMLWMAEGIVQPKGKKRLEDIGATYFDELFMRSFFELSNRRPSNEASSPFVKPSIIYEEIFFDLSEKLYIKSFFESSNNTGLGFVMHDLIHDLAQYVSGGTYCRREEYDEPSEVLTTARHLSYLKRSCTVEAPEFVTMESLCTLLDLEYCGDNFLSIKRFFPTMEYQFQFLRVLRFRKCSNPELPNSIGKLKHLRLLDISFSDIERLPDSITSLCNLQTLVLIHCWSLRELPKDMGNLVNLRHLFLPVVSWGDSYKMPLGMGNLTNLQTLSTFVMESKNSSELRDLSLLRGTLEISNLETIGNNEKEAMVDSLKNKVHLLGVRLRWSEYGSDVSFCDLGRDEKIEEDVLDQLHPHTNLESLWIEDYGGMRFPSWIGHHSFSNLEIVSLIDCCKCKFMPHLRQLPLLKHLVIEGCSAIKIIGSELFGDGSSSANKQFRSLETLRIGRMDEWVEWSEVVEEEQGEDGGQFPCLLELTIWCCPKLRMFSHHFPALVELEIGMCHDLRELPRILPSLRWLHIRRCPKLVVLPSLPFIEALHLADCEQITTSSDSDHLSSSTAAAPATPSLYNSFPYLRRLSVNFCPNIRDLLPILLPRESLQSL